MLVTVFPVVSSDTKTCLNNEGTTSHYIRNVMKNKSLLLARIDPKQFRRLFCTALTEL